MSRSSEQARQAFLDGIDRQLGGLDYLERREIHEELASHLRDIEERLAAGGIEGNAATVEAIATMGDPASIGLKLRDEHLARRLSFRDALLTGLPLLFLGAISAFVPVLDELRRLWGPHTDPLMPLLLLGGLLAGSLLLLRRTGHSSFAVLTGILAVFSLIPLTRLVQVTSQWPVSAFWLGLFFLIAVPGLLAFVVRFGALRTSLALLGGVGAYGMYAWGGPGGHAIYASDGGTFVLFGLAIVVIPFLGTLALGIAPRRWLLITGSGALLVSWSVIVLYHMVQFDAQLGPLPPLGLASTPAPPMQVSTLISVPVLVATFALLLSIRVLIHVQQRSAVRRLFDRLPVR